jgi:hypothetical protein
MKKEAPSAAGAALVSAIERRATRTIFPAKWIPLYYLRGILGPLQDHFFVHYKPAVKLFAECRERDGRLAPAIAPRRAA